MTTRMMMVLMGVLLVAGGSVRMVRAADFVPIVSRIFDAVKYEGKTRTMILRFDTGSVYAYRDVPRQVYDDFTRIVNHGEYFNRHIRKQYRFERLESYPGTWCARD